MTVLTSWYLDGKGCLLNIDGFEGEWTVLQSEIHIWENGKSFHMGHPTKEGH